MKNSIAAAQQWAAEDAALDALTIGTTAVTLFLVVCVLIRQAATLAS